MSAWKRCVFRIGLEAARLQPSLAGLKIRFTFQPRHLSLGALRLRERAGLFSSAPGGATAVDSERQGQKDPIPRAKNEECSRNRC